MAESFEAIYCEMQLSGNRPNRCFNSQSVGIVVSLFLLSVTAFAFLGFVLSLIW